MTESIPNVIVWAEFLSFKVILSPSSGKFRDANLLFESYILDFAPSLAISFIECGIYGRIVP